jgi:hypothetical protein
VPTSLSHQFVVAVTLTSLIFWFMLGSLTSIAFAYFDRNALKAVLLHQAERELPDQRLRFGKLRPR